MGKETFAFQAEVGKLLDIVARSLYSHKEIFLRELISNASDACDKLRYRALTDPALGGGEFGIRLVPDRKARTLTVSDNGIGMSRADLGELLGTIAKSGTQAFLAEMGKDAAKDASLIGQFGVGFYSAFMVADKVEVVTRKAGEDTAWRWTSDGRGSYEIEEAARPERGTDVIVHLSKDEDEFLEGGRLRDVVKRYSDHVQVPIVLVAGDEEETVNAASALWTRDRKEIGADQYKEFYHHLAHGFDDPWLVIHNRVEGVLSYTNLLFVPSARPFDLFRPERKPHVKLYVKRVFITDDCDELAPPYLRFLRGVVDSEDINLNISREMLQRDPKLAKIRAGLVKRVLGELAKKAEKEPDEYVAFWNNFGAVLKEGLYEDTAHREELLALVRFRTTAGEKLVSLEEYVGRMKPGQDAIYTIAAESVEAAARSPHLEGFRAKAIEVLLLTDPIDEFWIGAVAKFRDKPFRSATRGAPDLDKIAAESAADDKEAKAEPAAKEDVKSVDTLIAAFKTALGTAVKDVRASKRLTDSAVCLVAEEGDLDIHFERMLRQHGQLGAGETTPRVLEINPRHPLILALAAYAGTGPSETIAEAAFLLLDQARIVDGDAPSDTAAFVARLAKVMTRAFATSR